jgi:hypothetical protein
MKRRKRTVNLEARRQAVSRLSYNLWTDPIVVRFLRENREDGAEEFVESLDRAESDRRLKEMSENGDLEEYLAQWD